jgi:hypothetical protein
VALYLIRMHSNNIKEKEAIYKQYKLDEGGAGPLSKPDSQLNFAGAFMGADSAGVMDIICAKGSSVDKAARP